jgi:hypothetical protein
VEAGAERSADVRRLEAAARDFRQHGRKQERIALADESKANRAIGAKFPLQAFRRGHSRETTSEDDNSGLGDLNSPGRGFGSYNPKRKVAQRLCDQSKTGSIQHPPHELREQGAHAISGPLRPVASECWKQHEADNRP